MSVARGGIAVGRLACSGSWGVGIGVEEEASGVLQMMGEGIEEEVGGVCEVRGTLRV